MRIEARNCMKLTAAAACVMGLAATAAAQPWWDKCFDPMNTAPLSPDWAVATVGNSMMVVGIGFSGTATWGPNSPCGAPPGNTAQPVIGYIMLRMGSTGSMHSPDDTLCAITTGAPFAGNNWSYATIRVVAGDGSVDDSKFGDGGWNLFIGPQASFRRILAMQEVAGGVEAQLVVRSVGASIRFEWTLTNTNEDQVQVGLRHTSWLGMLNNSRGFSGFGENNYTLMPSGRPLRIHTNFVRSEDPVNFPDRVEFLFRQSDPYPSLRVLTEPDPLHPDQERADRLVIGDWLFVASPLWESVILPDAATFDTTFALFFEPVQVAPGQSRTIVYYLEPAWANNDVDLGTDGAFALTSEDPQLITFDPKGLNQLDPNPFFITAWVDNQYGQFGTSQELTMRNVELSLALPQGLDFAPGESATKSIAEIPPTGVRSVQWQVVANGLETGDLRYRVTCSAGQPGVSKALSDNVMVAATPVKDFFVGPQLIGFPWQFTSTTLTDILGLGSPADFVAFNWDVTAQSYAAAIEAERGRGQWIVATSDFPAHVLNGASSFGDEVPGEFHFILRRGWNLISNPYPYPVQLIHMLGMSARDPTNVFTWIELTQLGWIRSVLFSYNTIIGSYEFSSDPQQLLLPGVGYWIYVNSPDNIRLIWPPVYAPNLPGSPRSEQNPWSGQDNQWRLQLVARGEGQGDLSNYIGVAPTRGEAETLSVPEPPVVPDSKFRLAFVKNNPAGEEMRWAQDIRVSGGRHTFDMEFVAYEAGTYSISWPNIRQLPRNTRVRIMDLQSGQSRDLRMNSAYTFTMDAAGVRKFEVSIEAGAVSRPVIGSVLISSSTRDRTGPVTIQYALSAGAEVSVRILNTAGREVYTITRGRSENAGVNTVSWSKRTNSGRAVAPGNYIVEIIAETPEGARVRGTRPVIVVR